MISDWWSGRSTASQFSIMHTSINCGGPWKIWWKTASGDRWRYVFRGFNRRNCANRLETGSPNWGKLPITKPRNEFSSGVDVDKPGKEIGQTIYSFANQVSASCLSQKLFTNKATFQVSQRRATMPFLVNYMFGTDCLVSLEIKFVIIAFEGYPKMDMKITWRCQRRRRDGACIQSMCHYS